MKQKASQKGNNKGYLPPSSYNHMIGSPMDASDHPVDNVEHPHGNSAQQGPRNTPGSMSPYSPTIS